MTITPSCSSSGNDHFYATSNAGAAASVAGIAGSATAATAAAAGATAYGQQLQQTSSFGVSCTTGGSVATPAAAAGSTPQQRTQPILVKSDHFFEDLVPHDQGVLPQQAGGAGARYGAGGGRTGFNSESELNQTSDESQEAMRLFAASPPDPTSPHFRRQQLQQVVGRLGGGGAHTSSNESLASNKFYRPRSNTNQSLGSNTAVPPPTAAAAACVEEETNNSSNDDLKIGAFVSRTVSSAAAGSERATAVAAVAGNPTAADDDDPLLNLFNVDDRQSQGGLESKFKEMNVAEDGGARMKEQRGTGAEVSTLTAAAASSASRALHFSDSEQEHSSLPPSVRAAPFATKAATAAFPSKKEDFVMLELKTPFSAKTPDSGNSDLGIFFKTNEAGAAAAGTVAAASSATTGPAVTTAAAAVVTADRRVASTAGGMNLEAQLSNLDQQLSSFENNLEEFDEMLKTMEVAATSESESEVP